MLPDEMIDVYKGGRDDFFASILGGLEDVQKRYEDGEFNEEEPHSDNQSEDGFYENSPEPVENDDQEPAESEFFGSDESDDETNKVSDDDSPFFVGADASLSDSGGISDNPEKDDDSDDSDDNHSDKPGKIDPSDDLASNVADTKSDNESLPDSNDDVASSDEIILEKQPWLRKTSNTDSPEDDNADHTDSPEDDNAGKISKKRTRKKVKGKSEVKKKKLGKKSRKKIPETLDRMDSYLQRVQELIM